MTELYKDTESKLAFEDHIYVIDDILRERKLKGGESGFNPNPSANLSANHTISELCDNFNKQIRDGGSRIIENRTMIMILSRMALRVCYS